MPRDLATSRDFEALCCAPMSFELHFHVVLLLPKISSVQ
jgi:hypothetical protein